MSQEVQSVAKKNWIVRHPILTVLFGLFFISFIYTASNTGTPQKNQQTIAVGANKQTQAASSTKPEDLIAAKLKEAIPDLRVNGDYTVNAAQLDKEDADAPKGTQMFTVNVNVDSYLDQQWLVRDTGKIASQAFQDAFASSLPIYDAFVRYTAETSDKYGNKTNDAILIYHINKKVFAKVNWENFDPENLCSLLTDERKNDVMSAGCDFHANVK